jgi:hypothetical protein
MGIWTSLINDFLSTLYTPSGGTLCHAYNLGMTLQFRKHLLAQTGSDLRINPCILDILVAQVIRHVLNALAGF